MTINQFATQFFGNKLINNDTLNLWYNDFKSSGYSYEKWSALLKTRA